MSDLIAFLRARLDERERSIHHAIATYEQGFGEFDLADVEAKRRILKECAWTSKAAVSTSAVAGLAVMTMRLLALPYADHPDYRQEWKP